MTAAPGIGEHRDARERACDERRIHLADPGKTAPGTCGCGVADVDSDSNGIVDCLEPQADVAVGIEQSSATVRVKRKVQYGLVVTNAGPSLANGVVVTATLSGVPVQRPRLAKGCTTSGVTIVCTFGDLAVGTTATRTISVTPLAAGTLTVSATVSSATLDPNGGNQEASVDTVVR